MLSITEDGFGKRTSAYEYRVAGRGGQGIANIDISRGTGKPPTLVVSSFPVLETDQIVMVSDAGQIIRCPVDQISIVGRGSRGVTLFDTAEGQRVVSVSRLRDVAETGDAADAGGDDGS